MDFRSLTGPLLFFVAVIAAMQVAAGIAGIVAPDSSVPAYLNLLVLVVATVWAGRMFGNASGRIPKIEERFAFGILGTLASMVINFAYLAVMLRWYGLPVTMETVMTALNRGKVPAGGEASFFIGYGGLAFLFGVAISIVGFGVGAKKALR